MVMKVGTTPTAKMVHAGQRTDNANTNLSETHKRVLVVEQVMHLLILRRI